jgi:Zn-dependent M16 (insulinase) family peptidase
MAGSEHSASGVEEAILGVISSVDKPGSPAGEAKQDFHNRRFGRSHEQRMLFRQAVLEVTLSDLKRVAAEYLQPEHASVAIITGTSGREESAGIIEQLGMRLCEL